MPFTGKNKNYENTYINIYFTKNKRIKNKKNNNKKLKD
jgi:hypothetical protein